MSAPLTGTFGIRSLDHRDDGQYSRNDVYASAAVGDSKGLPDYQTSLTQKKEHQTSTQVQLADRDTDVIGNLGKH